MDSHRVAQALRARVPQLVEAGVDLDALTATALSAWTAAPPSAAPTAGPDSGRAAGYARVCAVVNATWPAGYTSGVHVGHAVTTGYVAAAALDRAEPARPGMSEAHRDLANRLQAARVSSDALREYLTGDGWRHTRTWRGAAIFQTSVSGTEIAETLVPPPGVRDHIQRILDAAATVAAVDDRDVASVLAGLALPPQRATLSHAALRYLWQVYDAAANLAHLPPRVRDPGPATNDHLTAYGDWGDTTDTGRLVAAARVGYQHGFGQGHGDGSWSAGARLLSQLQPADNADPPTSVRIDGHTPTQWLRAVDVDARWAANAARHSRQPAQVPPACAAGRAFCALNLDPPTETATSHPTPPPVSPQQHRTGRHR